MKKQILSLVVLALVISLFGCAAPSESTAPSEENITTHAAQTESAEKPTVDPSGAEVIIPDEIHSVVVLSPAISETLVAIGCEDQIIGYDSQSSGLEGLPADVPVFDMINPDMEQLAALKPDVLFVSNMTMYDQANPYEQLINMGTCVLCVPSANSISEIEEDLNFIAAAMGKAEEGDKLVADMSSELQQIAELGKTVTEQKKVYFEIGAAPNMYSFGNGVFLNEMLEMIGAQNILADQEGWLAVEGETVAAANPDVILTNVNYLDDAIGEILSRSGWEGVSAIQNQQVYYIDNMSSSLSNHNIVKAVKQMAESVYPDVFKNN